jgi:hypothetical protein
MRPSCISRSRLPYVLTLLKPWSCTPTWVTCEAITRTVLCRPSSRKDRSPVASKWRTEAPTWKPCVHSVQPRAV